MVSKLEKITKKLILAKKRIDKIETLPQFKRKSIPIEPIEIPIIPMSLPKKPEFSIDLGKLNQFVQDKEVRAIECPGPDQNIKIKKRQIAETSVQLTEKEISDIIKRFSMASGVPLTPIMKAAFGELTINAFIFPTTSKFLIIRKSL